MVLSYSIFDPIKSHVSCLEIFFVSSFRLLCCLPLYCPLPSVSVVVDDPYLLGTSSLWKLLDEIFQNKPPSYASVGRCRNISRDAAFYMHRSVLRGHLLNRVRWILVLGKNILQLFFMPPVLICRMYWTYYMRIIIPLFLYSDCCVWMRCAII